MRTCRKCKCTDDTIAQLGYWVEDDLCSECASDEEKLQQTNVLNGTNEEDNFNKLD